MTPTAEQERQHSTAREYATWVGLLVLAAWLLHPILTPAHVEGFSASVVSLALHLHAGQLADYDRLYPANLEYFALSRLAAVTFVSTLISTFGMTGETAMRATMWAGFVVLAVSSYVLIRRWSRAPSIVVVAVLLLIPGFGESAFFYNDNVFSAALTVSALALLASYPGFVATFFSGIVFGAGIVARIDGVLLAPAVVLIGYEQNGLGRRFVVRALVFTVGVLIPVVTLPAVLHATILDVVHITRYAIGLWGVPFSLDAHLLQLSLFLGIPAAVLIALGVYALAGRREVARLLLLAGVPLLFNLVALGKIWQSRQLLSLTPFLGALALLGWEHVTTRARSADPAMRRMVVGITCAVMLAPLMVVRLSDGPRAPYGRLWTPPLWTRWQSASRATMVELRAITKALPRGTTAILTDTWDADRYLHLALQETGYHVVQSGPTDSSCARVAEVLDRGQQRVLHVRLHQPFLRSWKSLAAERLERFGLSCLRAAEPSATYVLAPPDRLQWASAGVADTTREHLRRASRIMQESGYDPQVAILLDSALMMAMTKSDSATAKSERDSLGTPGAVKDLAQAERLMSAQVWKGDGAAP